MLSAADTMQLLQSLICIVVVSLVTAPPSKEIEADYEAVKNGEN